MVMKSVSVKYILLYFAADLSFKSGRAYVINTVLVQLLSLPEGQNESFTQVEDH